MSKLLFIQIALLYAFHVSAQDYEFSNKLILFKELDDRKNICLCNEDKSAQEYIFVDQNNFIHYVREAFRTENYGYKYDSSVINGSLTITPVQYRIPHNVESIFKFYLENNDLSILHLDSSKTVKKLKFYDFRQASQISTTMPFAENKEFKGLTIKLLSTDSTIRFNSTRFNCWGFEQTFKDGGILNIFKIYIDKKSLLPVFYEIDYINTGAVFVDNGLSHTKFSIWGILELDNQASKQMNIWQDLKTTIHH